MKIILITIAIIAISIVGGLAAISSMDTNVTEENIRKEIAIEPSSETPAPTPIPLQ